MANRIKLTQKEIEVYTKGLAKELANLKTGTSVTYKVNPMEVKNAKAELFLSAQAYVKIKNLVDKCSQEIGWHGFTRRDGNKFYIDDIVIFPQVVTAATVTPDEKAYTEWTNKLSDDEYNNMHFHGHSHVNMGVTPSVTDTTYYNNKIQNIDDYYIFAIFNKSEKYTVFIYDIENNIMYDTKDITVHFPFDEFKEWAEKEIKDNVSSVTVTTPTQQTDYGYYGDFGGYWNSRNKKKSKSSKTKAAKEKEEVDFNLPPYLQSIVDNPTEDKIENLSYIDASYILEAFISNAEKTGDDSKPDDWTEEQYEALLEAAGLQ